MVPAVNLGPLVLPTGPIIYLIAIWICLMVAERSAYWLDLDAEIMSALVTAGIIAGFVGARLTFVALYWPAFQDSLLSIVWPLNTGFSLWGGLFFGASAMFFYGRYKQLDAASYLDALAPVLLVGLLFASLADFVSGPGYGTFTTLPWGIETFGVRRHPVQLYEIAVAFAALLVWWLMARRRAYNGQAFLVATAVYAAGRLFVDAFRANAWITPGGWHGLQIVCLTVALASLVLLMSHSQKARYLQASA